MDPVAVHKSYFHQNMYFEEYVVQCEVLYQIEFLVEEHNHRIVDMGAWEVKGQNAYEMFE